MKKFVLCDIVTIELSEDGVSKLNEFKNNILPKYNNMLKNNELCEKYNVDMNKRIRLSLFEVMFIFCNNSSILRFIEYMNSVTFCPNEQYIKYIIFDN